MTEKYSGLRECLDDNERLGNPFFIWSVELARAILADRDAQADKIAQGKVTIRRLEAERDALREALTLLLHEVDESAIAGAKDYGWPVAVSKSRAALQGVQDNEKESTVRNKT
jgi:hypothetical protein